jgi:RimJ/RimL family protein N-acetyltransferase
MASFPRPAIRSDRLDLREFEPDDLDLVGEEAAAGELEAMPLGVPANAVELTEWLDMGMHLTGRDNGVRLMMVDRAAGRIVGSISVFNVDWQVRSAEIGYAVRTGAAMEDDGPHDRTIYSLLDDEL